MKPEIKAMLPEMPHARESSLFPGREYVIRQADFEAWLDKLTEGAQKLYGTGTSEWTDRIYDGDKITALLICPREIKKQTSLEIALKALKSLQEYAEDRATQKFIKETLAHIEAAK